MTDFVVSSFPYTVSSVFLRGILKHTHTHTHIHTLIASSALCRCLEIVHTWHSYWSAENSTSEFFLYGRCDIYFLILVSVCLVKFQEGGLPLLWVKIGRFPGDIITQIDWSETSSYLIMELFLLFKQNFLVHLVCTLYFPSGIKFSPVFLLMFT